MQVRLAFCPRGEQQLFSRYGPYLDLPKLWGWYPAIDDLKRFDGNLRPILSEFDMEVGRLMIVPIELDLGSIDNGNCRHTRLHYHKSSTSRAGSSRLSLTRTKNVTASLPSMTRWS